MSEIGVAGAPDISRAFRGRWPGSSVWLGAAWLPLMFGLPLSARAQAQDGAKLFQSYCAVCHSDRAGANKVGPSLYGVSGRKAGTVPDYSYSDAMKNSGIIWTSAALDKYLAAPRSLPNAKMMFPGIPNQAERKAIID